MKRILLLWTSLGLVGAGIALLATAQEPAPPAFERGEASAADEEGADFEEDLPKQLQVQVEFIEMSHETMTKLLFKAKPTSADATLLREQLQEMVEKKEASVFETMIMIAKSGQKATTESIHEFIYPTEYEPSDGLPVPTAQAQGPSNPPVPKHVYPAVPVAFEPRNLGSTLDIEPTIDFSEQNIDLRLAPEIIWHTGNNSWFKGKDSLGNDFDVLIPEFYVVRLSTSLTCFNGKYHVAGVVSPKDEKGNTDHKRKMMVFVKCDILVVK